MVPVADGYFRLERFRFDRNGSRVLSLTAGDLACTPCAGAPEEPAGRTCGLVLAFTESEYLWAYSLICFNPPLASRPSDLRRRVLYGRTR